MNRGQERLVRMGLLWRAATTRSICGHTTTARICRDQRKAILPEKLEEIKINMKMPLGLMHKGIAS